MLILYLLSMCILLMDNTMFALPLPWWEVHGEGRREGYRRFGDWFNFLTIIQGGFENKLWIDFPWTFKLSFPASEWRSKIIYQGERTGINNLTSFKTDLNDAFSLPQSPGLFWWPTSPFYSLSVLCLLSLIPHIHQGPHRSCTQERIFACCPPPPSYIVLIIWDPSSTFCHHS